MISGGNVSDLKPGVPIAGDQPVLKTRIKRQLIIGEETDYRLDAERLRVANPRIDIYRGDCFASFSTVSRPPSAKKLLFDYTLNQACPNVG